MKFLFDLLPVIVFFAGYRAGITLPEYGLHKPIELASALMIAVTVGQIGWLKLRGKPVEIMQWIGLGLSVVLGGATILLHSSTFIFWKPTALYSAMAIAMLVSHYGFRKPPLKTLIGKEISLPDGKWTQLMWIWVIFFTLMAVLNLAVAFHVPESTWVNFKLICVFAITPAFVIGQAIWLAKHLPKEQTSVEES